jgi:hypothetical protein
VPPIVKNAKLNKGKVISQQSNSVMVIKLRDKKDDTMISIFHDDTLRTLRKRGVEVKRPVCVLEYNQQMGRYISWRGKGGQSGTETV